MESKGQQARQKVKKKVETGQEDLKKKVDDLKKKVQAGKVDLEKKVDDLQKDVDDLQKKMDELVKAPGQQNQKKSKK